MKAYVWNWPARSPAFPGDRNVCWRYEDLPSGHMSMSPAYGTSVEVAEEGVVRQLRAQGHIVEELGSLDSLDSRDSRDEKAVETRIREVSR